MIRNVQLTNHNFLVSGPECNNERIVPYIIDKNTDRMICKCCNIDMAKSKTRSFIDKTINSRLLAQRSKAVFETNKTAI